MNKRGKLFIVSGFAGTGKSTITKGLVKNYDCYELSISATTRPARGNEQHGREYFFLSKEEFEGLIEAEGFLEHAIYLDHHYGTPKEWVNSRLEEGKDVILEIEMQGALQIKANIPDCLLIFLLPPSIEELEKRLINRGTETSEQIANRIRRAKEEVDYIQHYDYIVINEDVEKTIEIVHNIVQSEKYKVNCNLDFVRDYIRDFTK